MSKPVGISYSGGTSSEWLVRSVIAGVIPRPENVAVFCADTKDEHWWTYEAMDRVEVACHNAGIPFFRDSHREGLAESVMAATRGERKRIDTPPFWTENQGGGRGQLTQQCSEVFKTAVVRRMQSAWLKSIGLPKKITTWIGFAADEQHRANKAIARKDVQWVDLDFPAIRYGAVRAQQRADVTRWAGRAPHFSMCVQCPYKTPNRWRQTDASDLVKAYEVDEAIRHGLENIGVDGPCYLSDRLIPVEALIRNGDPQPSLPGLDAPGCDGGACFL